MNNQQELGGLGGHITITKNATSRRPTKSDSY